MDSRDQLVRLLELLYASPGSERHWSEFLLALTDTLHGSCANLIIHDYGLHRTAVPVTAKTEPEALSEYVREWGRADPWQRRSQTRPLKAGTVVLGEELVTDAEFTATDFHRGFGRHHDVGRCVIGTIEATSTGVSVVSINRAQRQRRFDARDEALIRALLPHLQRAIHLHRRLSGADIVSSAAVEAIEQLSHGVFFVSAIAELRHANRFGRSLLAEGDGLVCDHAELRAARDRDTRRLREAISRAAHRSGEDSPGHSGLLVVSRGSGREPLNVLVCPVAQRAPFALGESTPVVVFATDPERASAVAGADLAERYSLTPAEIRLAVELASGRDLEGAARVLNVAHSTAKSTLKAVFAKTGCRRQADLVRLLLSSPPVVRRSI